MGTADLGSIFRRLLVAFVIMALGLAVPLLATRASHAQTVGQILVEGTQRIEPATVLSYMVIAPGDRFDDERIDRSLKALFATGLFADVTMRPQGSDLVVRVVENPIINRLAFEGNQKITEETMLKEVQLRPRQVYTRAKVQSDLQRILQLYRRSGRFAATVEPKVIQLPQNRVDLVFEIAEGAPTTINRIRFIGNSKYSDGRLREAITTKETAWYRFLSSDDIYDPDRLTYDREQLRKFYLSKGYADFRVVSAVAELTPSREAFFITFTLEEGEQYKFGKIDITSGIKDIDLAPFYAIVPMQTGDTYDADRVEKAVQDITFELGRLGYAFVDVKPEIKRSPTGKVLDFTFRIDEGQRVYVERINISGNVRTLDKVIRREFRVVEGDAFNTAKLRRSRQRLRGLAFFEKVDIAENRGTTPDKVQIDVSVQEKSTGELSIGAGYSTTEALLGDIGLRERNLLGRGQDIRVNLSLSFKRQQIDHSFTEPYFLDRELSAGYDVFHRKQDLQRRSGFDQTSTGGGLRTGFPITENLSASTFYRVRHDLIENLASTVSDVIRRQAGGSVTSLVGYSIAYDRRDDKIEPTSGYIFRGGNELGGLGGTEHFIRTSGNYTHFFSIADEWVLSGSVDGGHIKGISDDVNIVNRFFVGGDSFRGFKQGGIGVRDPVSGDALGANIYYTGTAELTFPLGLPKEFGMKGRVFSIVGSAYDVDEKSFAVLSSSALRASSGFGVTWVSPLGPINIDIAVPVIKQEFDQHEYFRFNFGTRF